MRREKFKSWLQTQTDNPTVIATRVSEAERVNKFHGDLDSHYDNDSFVDIIRKLSYSMEDKRNNSPNLSGIPINGDFYNGLASYKAAVNLYKKFCVEEGTSESTTQEIYSPSGSQLAPPAAGGKIGLEKDMQKALRAGIEQLEDGLVIIDNDAEKKVESGFIDITAKDSKGAVVVIELKIEEAGQKAVAQIASYMGDVLAEYDKTGTEVRGILVASDFNSKAISASRVTQNLQLKKYKVHFTFEDSTG